MSRKTDDIFTIVAFILFVVIMIAAMVWEVQVQWTDYQAKRAIIRMEQNSRK